MCEACGNTVAILSSLNFEAGCNPNNVGFLPGLGWRRPRVVVNQYWWNAGRVLPPTGNPIGTVNHFENSSLNSIFYPRSEGNPASFALYDRWGDVINSGNEFVSVQTSLSLAAAAWLAAQSPANRSQQWSATDVTAAGGNITPSLGEVAINAPQTVHFTSSLALAGARIVWDQLGYQPAFGSTFTFTPTVVGERTLGAEAALADGRRAFINHTFWVYDPVNGGIEHTPDGNTVALYHFNSDLTTDSSGNGHALTVHGSPILASNRSWMRSPSGKVARFTGIGCFLEVQIPDSVILPGSGPTPMHPLTIEAWIYPRAFKTDAQGLTQKILSLRQDSDAAWELYYQPYQTPDAPQVYAHQGSVIDRSVWAQYVSPNTWHSLKILFDETGTTRAYIDGVLRGTVAFSPNYGRTSPWILTVGNFDGDIEELRISR